MPCIKLENLCILNRVKPKTDANLKSFIRKEIVFPKVQGRLQQMTEMNRMGEIFNRMEMNKNINHCMGISTYWIN